MSWRAFSLSYASSSIPTASSRSADTTASAFPISLVISASSPACVSSVASFPWFLRPLQESHCEQALDRCWSMTYHHGECSYRHAGEEEEEEEEEDEKEDEEEEEKEEKEEEGEEEEEEEAEEIRRQSSARSQ